eukprot:CAMPEP_0115145712 /NCGR_PEP_ID=MMETSP0227-20121206/62284_1 /TAXON_ID=89957 /ORGANISM="Polarella glacialis, Strain CCMP 1383" /LENGTH=177 /DNA_ID=CAMNT_0002555293 /DNA_START=221 /DNA_END=754 /DNA_ORIENTATION=+
MWDARTQGAPHVGGLPAACRKPVLGTCLRHVSNATEVQVHGCRYPNVQSPHHPACRRHLIVIGRHEEEHPRSICEVSQVEEPVGSVQVAPAAALRHRHNFDFTPAGGLSCDGRPAELHERELYELLRGGRHQDLAQECTVGQNLGSSTQLDAISACTSLIADLVDQTQDGSVTRCHH